MEKSLYLHIGCHKTGTTAFQESCLANKEKLQQQGFHFCHEPGSPANWGQIVNFTRDGEFPEFWFWKTGLERLEKQFDNNSSKTLISAEDFFFLNRDSIGKLSDLTKANFSNITIVLYLRRQDKLALSHKAQSGRTEQSAIVFGTELKPLPTITPSVRHYLDFHQRINDWKNFFPNAQWVIRSYDAAVNETGDIPRDVFQKVGVDDSDFARVGRVNESIQRNAAYFVLLLRQNGVSQHDINKLWDTGRISNTGGKICASKSDSIEFFSEFDEENARLYNLLNQSNFFSSEFDEISPENSIDSFDKFLIEAAPELLADFVKQASVQNAIKLADAAGIVIKNHPVAAKKILEVAQGMNPNGKRISKLLQSLK